MAKHVQSVEQMAIQSFLCKRKHNGVYAQTLLFMAGHVTRTRGFEGIRKLLWVIGQKGNEVVGVQRCLLLLRLVNEWKCVADYSYTLKDQVNLEMGALEEEFEVIFSVEQWLIKGFIMLRNGKLQCEAGKKLLLTLIEGVQQAGAVLKYAPELLSTLCAKARSRLHFPHGEENYLCGSGKDRLGAVQTLSAVPKPEAVCRAVVKALGEVAEPEVVASVASREGGRYELDICRASAEILGKLAETNVDALEVLLDAVRDTTLVTRRAAVEALGKLRVADAAVLTALQHAIMDNEPDIHRAAVEALSKLAETDAAALAVLQEAANYNERDGCQASGEALLKFTEPDHSSLAALQEALRNNEPNVRRAAAKALGKLAETNAAALTILLRAVKNDASYVRRAVIDALGKLQVVDVAVLAALLEAAQNDLPSVCVAAVEALGKLAETDAAALTVLLQDIKHDDNYISHAAAKALLHSTIPLERLIDVYWATRRKYFISFIAYRLFHVPLVIEEGKAILFVQPGETKEWSCSGQEITANDINNFGKLIQDAIYSYCRPVPVVWPNPCSYITQCLTCLCIGVGLCNVCQSFSDCIPEMFIESGLLH